jgi:hypothetical protein
MQRDALSSSALDVQEAASASHARELRTSFCAFCPRGVGVERLRDLPTERGKHFEALGLNPE